MSKIYGIVGSLIVLVVIGIVFSLHTVSGGYVGVVYDRANGGVQKEVLNEGWHLLKPTVKITDYPISTETVEPKKMTLSTKDGKPLTAKVSYDYHIDVEKVSSVYKKFRGAKTEVIEDGWLKTRLTSALVGETGKYSILEVYQGTGLIKDAVLETFKKDVQKHGFVIENLTIGTPIADEATQKVLQENINEQQKVEKAQTQQKRVKIEAQTKVEEEKGAAEARLIKADSQAQANEKIRKSLTTDLIKNKTVEKWNGVLPQVSSDANAIVDLK